MDMEQEVKQDAPYMPTLRRAGTVLMAVGAVDIAAMILCAAGGIAYSSNFNVFALVAGYILYHGNLRAANVIAWIAAFLLTSFLSMLVFLPALEPIDLLLLKVKLQPLPYAISAVTYVVAVILLNWVINELRTDTIVLAQEIAGIKVRRLIAPVVLAICVSIVVSIAVPVMLGGEAGQRAVHLAGLKLGANYKYHVKSLKIKKSPEGKHVSGVVTAYNDNEIKTVEVDWTDK